MEDLLIPDYHYIHLEDDFSNLREKLDWAKKYPEKVEAIIKNAHNFINIFKDIKAEELIEKEVLNLYFERINYQSI